MVNNLFVKCLIVGWDDNIGPTIADQAGEEEFEITIQDAVVHVSSTFGGAGIYGYENPQFLRLIEMPSVHQPYFELYFNYFLFDKTNKTRGYYGSFIIYYDSNKMPPSRSKRREIEEYFKQRYIELERKNKKTSAKDILKRVNEIVSDQSDLIFQRSVSDILQSLFYHEGVLLVSLLNAELQIEVMKPRSEIKDSKILTDLYGYEVDIINSSIRGSTMTNAIDLAMQNKLQGKGLKRYVNSLNKKSNPIKELYSVNTIDGSDYQHMITTIKLYDKIYFLSIHATYLISKTVLSQEISSLQTKIEDLLETV